MVDLPGRIFYKLAELAERWNKSEDDLLHLAAQGSLRVTCSKLLKICDLGEDYDDYLDNHDDQLEFFSTDENIPLIVENIRELMSGTKEVKPLWKLKSGRSGCNAEWHHDGLTLLDTKITLSDLVVLSVEVNRMEELHPILRQQKIGVDTLGEAVKMILSENHPWHSEPLANAVRAWLDLYSKREGNRNDNSYRPPAGNAKFIENWFAKNVVGQIGSSTMAHYCFIINPSKQGGPSKIPE